MKRGGLLVAGIVTLGLLAAPGAAAKTFKVTRTADSAPNGCGQGGCTLREAVIAANARNGRDKIVLRSGKTYELAISGADEEVAATGDLDLTGPTTVTASKRRPATIDAQLLDRIFDTYGPASFSRLAMRGGVTQGFLGEEDGGAIRSADGGLQLSRCKLQGIVAPPLGLGASNAAVQKIEGGSGSIRLSRTTVRGTNGTAVLTRGNGAIEINRSRLLDNFYGAATSFGSAGIAITRSTVSGGERSAVTDFEGGGVRLTRSRVQAFDQDALLDFDAGDIVASRSQITGNGQDGMTNFGGGGIKVTRSRIAGNGQAAVNNFGSGGVRMTRSRVTGNGGGVGNSGGGGIRVTGSAIADNVSTGVGDSGSGGVTVTGSRITDSGGQGVSDFGSGGVRVSGSLVARSDDQGVQDFDGGGVEIVNSLVARSGNQGVQDFDGGGLSIVGSDVLQSGNQGVQNFGSGNLTLRNARVAGSANEAVAQFETGALRISRSTVSGGQSGGVFVDVQAAPSSIVASTISGNRTSGNGGGIENDGELVVRNSTIANNRADQSGGGIANTGILRLNNVTLARNVADADNNAVGAGGGIQSSIIATTEFGNSLIALNDQRGGDADDCSGNYLSTGGNLRTDGVDCAGFDGPGDRVRSNPKLGPLRRNGGPTKTIGLKPGSPAIGGARKGSAENRDQRGRKRDNQPDTGAFER